MRERLLNFEQDEAVDYFGLASFDRVLKSTISLCPECLRHVPALVYTRAPRVWMRKHCPVHGASDALLENDEKFYHLSNKDQWGRGYASEAVLAFPLFSDRANEFASNCDQSFADQYENKSCTILVEITNACNLACAVCYSDAKGNRFLPLSEFKSHILSLIERKKALDSLQVTGGEAILHPEFWEMIDFLSALPQVKKIYLPTNGIAFAKEDIAAKLLPYREKLMVLLQFDGSGAESNQPLRNANPVHFRERSLENIGRLGIHMQLTMTITLGVNDHEIGWVIKKGMEHDQIKVIALQPVTYSGRYDLGQNPEKRLTLSDVIKAAATQVGQYTSIEDFKPIPCSHPNCGWITLFARRFGLKVNIARRIDLDRAMNQVANRTLLNTSELRSVIGSAPGTSLKHITEWAGKKLIRSKDIFAIAIKPFMDRFNYDQDRISACCHHLLNTDGVPISFCEYNARLRQQDSWDRFPALKQSSHTHA